MQQEVRSVPEMEQAGNALLSMGAGAALVKGGHLAGDVSPDLFHNGREATWLEAARIATRNTHGTGCTLSSAIAAYLALDRPMADAVAGAKDYLTNSLAAADHVPVGHGHGPVHHFHRLWPLLEKVRETDR